MNAAITITSKEIRADGNIIDYHLCDGCRAWTVTDGKYTGMRCNCPEYEDNATCRHIAHVTSVLVASASAEASHPIDNDSYVAAYNRYLEWTAQEQDEEIAAYVDAMARDGYSADDLGTAPYTIIIGDAA